MIPEPLSERDVLVAARLFFGLRGTDGTLTERGVQSDSGLAGVPEERASSESGGSSPDSARSVSVSSASASGDTGQEHGDPPADAPARQMGALSERDKEAGTGGRPASANASPVDAPTSASLSLSALPADWYRDPNGNVRHRLDNRLIRCTKTVARGVRCGLPFEHPGACRA